MDDVYVGRLRIGSLGSVCRLPLLFAFAFGSFARTSPLAEAPLEWQCLASLIVVSGKRGVPAERSFADQLAWPFAP